MSNNNITVSGATATAGGTTAISGNSFGKQLFTGTLNQTVTLPG